MSHRDFVLLGARLTNHASSGPDDRSGVNAIWTAERQDLADQFEQFRGGAPSPASTRPKMHSIIEACIDGRLTVWSSGFSSGSSSSTMTICVSGQVPATAHANGLPVD